MCHNVEKKEWKQTITAGVTHPSCQSHSSFTDYINIIHEKMSDMEVKEYGRSVHLLVSYLLVLMPSSSSSLSVYVELFFVSLSQLRYKMSYFTELIIYSLSRFKVSSSLSS